MIVRRTAQMAQMKTLMFVSLSKSKTLKKTTSDRDEILLHLLGSKTKLQLPKKEVLSTQIFGQMLVFPVEDEYGGVTDVGV